MSPPRPAAGRSGGMHAALSSPVRRRLLDLLQQSPSPRTVQELGEVVGLHQSTIRSHLELLRRAGLVARAPRTSRAPGRPATAYVDAAGPGGDGSDRAYRQLAGLLAAHLSDTAEERAERAERAGEAWAGQLVPEPGEAGTVADAAGQIRDLFAEIGFGPELSTDGAEHQIALRACPFRDIAHERPEVCSVHRGLLRGGTERFGATAQTRLLPFVEPELCLAVLGPGSGAAPA